MKNFKSIIAAITAAIMLFSLTACQNNASVDVDRDVTVASSKTAVTNATENTNETISVELSTTTATESTTIAVTNSKGETVKATKADNNNAVVKTTTKKSSSNNSSYKAPATTKKTSSGSSSNKTQATTKKSSSSAKPQATTKKSTSSNNNSSNSSGQAYDKTRGEYMDSATTKTVFTYEDGTKTIGYFTSGHGSATYTDTDGYKRTITDYKAFTGALTYCPICGRNLIDPDHFMDAGKNGTCYHTYMGEDTCLFCDAKIGANECHSCGSPAYTCRVCGKKVAKGEKHRHNP